MAMALPRGHNTRDLVHITDFSLSSFIPNSQHLVSVTHINDPGSFFVRLISVNDNMETLNARGDRITSEQVAVRLRVIYRSETLRKFVRGNIEYIRFTEQHLTCTIYAIDYGCYDMNVFQEDIYLPVSPASLHCPPLAIHCQLNMCEAKEETFDEAAIDAMKFFVGQHTAKITVIFKRDDKLIVKLKTVECPDDVAMMLALLHFTTLSSGPNTVNRIQNGSVFPGVIRYKFKALNCGDRLCVRVQSGNSIEKFYVAEINDYKKYVRDLFQFTEYCRSQPKTEIEAAINDSRCCGIRICRTNQYERGIVLKHSKPGRVLAKLIDLGNEIDVSHDDVKHAPSEVYNILPAIAIFCSSSEDQTWKTGLPKFLYPGYQFIIEITQMGDGLNLPHKVNLSQMLTP